jgi:hypothetical protein
MATTTVGIKLDATVSGADQVKKLKEEIKAAEAEAKKISKEFGASSVEAQKAAEKVTKLAQGLDSFKSIKTQIREATQEAVRLAQQFGEFAPEAVAAAKRVAELKDQMGDFQQRVAGLNPDKFEAVATVAQGIAGGISAMTGAMALFGAESEDVQKTMMQVQGAMAFAQGIQQLLNMQNALGAVATMIRTNVVTAFATLKGAMAATGIGLLIVAIASAIQYLNDLGSEAEKAAERSKEALDFIDRVSQATQKSMEITIEKRKLEGYSEKVLHETRIRFMNQRVKMLEEELKKDLGNLEVERRLTEAREDIVLEELKFRNKNREDNARKNKEANDKLVEQEKERQAKLKEQRDKEAADALQRRATLLALEQNTLEQQIEAADAAFATRVKAYKDQNFTEVEINKLRDAELEKIRTEFYAKQKADQEKAAADRKAIADKEIADTVKATDDFFKAQQLKNIGNNEALAQLEVQRLEAQIQNARDYGQSTVDLELALAQKKKDIRDKDVADAKAAQQATIKLTADGFAMIAEMATTFAGQSEEQQKKAFEIKKAASIAQAIVETYMAAQSAYASQLSIATPDAPIRASIAAGLAIASGLARVSAIQKTKFDSKGGTGGGGGGGVAPAPSFTPTAGGALPEEAQFGGMGRVYVLEGDITKTQTRVRRLRNTSVV